jgi:predicted phage terminase large subunit-like protein
MDLKAVSLKISEIIKNGCFDYVPYEDYYGISREIQKEDNGAGVVMLKWLSETIMERMPALVGRDLELGRKVMGLHRRVLLAAAPWDFDSYMLFVEWNREPSKKFWPPRRRTLKPIADAMQALTDDKLDLLAVSLPPGAGKSTLAFFYLTFEGGRNPDLPILTGSHSNSWIRGAYDECLRIMDPKGEYLWNEVFPTVQISNTNAKDCRIDLGRRKRFETFEFTSIGTGNAGLYRAANLLYCDDLISSLEVALSPDRLSKLWGIYNTDLRQRKIGDRCKELHIATRWATGDVISLLEQTYDGDERARFISIPALDENDESNFDYAYGVGFSTKFYHEQRDIMDDVNWRALYMQQPIDREGRLYDPDELRRYFELPDGEPDAIISVCDTKDRGDDDCVMPVAYVYGDNYYIEDILCDNSKPEIVDELLIQMLIKHRVQMSCFESNSAGGRVAQTVQAGVKARGGITKIETRYTTQNKETKILANSPWTKAHCLFKDDSVSDRGYKRALTKLCGYSVSSRNKHDDVPDAFAQLAIYAESMGGAKVKVIARPF